MLSSVAFLQNIGSLELIIILAVALMIFGNKLPEVVRNASRTLGQFKRGMEDASNQVRREMEQAAAEADPTEDIKAAVSGAMADENPVPDDYASTDPQDYGYDSNDDGSEGYVENGSSCADTSNAESTGSSTESVSTDAVPADAASVVPEQVAVESTPASTDGPPAEPEARSQPMVDPSEAAPGNAPDSGLSEALAVPAAEVAAAETPSPEAPPASDTSQLPSAAPADPAEVNPRVAVQPAKETPAANPPSTTDDAQKG